MLIDCDSCTARGTGCADCVVTVLLGAPPGERGTEPVLLPVPPVPAARVRELAAATVRGPIGFRF